MPLLEITDLHLHYAAGDRVVRAVDGITFAIEKRGEALGVVGESGSGKTSLATALMRLLPKNVARFDGSIRLDGQEILKLSNEEYRKQIRWSRIAMVFQGAMSVLNPVLESRRADCRAIDLRRRGRQTSGPHQSRGAAGACRAHARYLQPLSA